MMTAPVGRSFFEEQRMNHKRTLLFVGLGFVWVGTLGFWAIFIQMVFYSFVLQFFNRPVPLAFQGDAPLVWSGWGALGFLFTWSLLAAIFFWRSSAALPRLIGARPITGLDEKRLSRVLELLLAASGERNSRPNLFLWEIATPNAFACGRSPEAGSIVVTRGLMDLMDDDELECILGHELAHLKNHDTIYIVQAIAFVSMLLAVAHLGAALAVVIVALTALAVAVIIGVIKEAFEGDDGLVGCVLAIFAVGLIFAVITAGFTILLACLALFGGLVLIVGLGMPCAASAISKSREYLADAVAAHWTGNPGALARALTKIAGPSEDLPLRGALVRPLLFSHGKLSLRKESVRWLDLLMQTHPRIDHRIAALAEMDGLTYSASRRNTEAKWQSFLRSAEWSLPLLLSAVLIGGSLWLIPWQEEEMVSWFSLGLGSRRPAETVLVPKRGFINEPVVRLRSEASTESRIIARLEEGTEVQIFQWTQGQEAERGWYRVRISDGINSSEGWVAVHLVNAPTD